MNKKYISPCIRVKVISSATPMAASVTISSTPKNKVESDISDPTMSSGENAVGESVGVATNGEADSKRFNLWGSPDVEE